MSDPAHQGADSSRDSDVSEEPACPVTIELCPLILCSPQQVPAALQDGEPKPVVKLIWEDLEFATSGRCNCSLTTIFQSEGAASRFHLDFLQQLGERKLARVQRTACLLYDKGCLLTALTLARNRITWEVMHEEAEAHEVMPGGDAANTWPIIQKHLIPRWAWSSDEVELKLQAEDSELELHRRLSNLEAMHRVSAQRTRDQLRMASEAMDRIEQMILASVRDENSSESQSSQETVMRGSNFLRNSGTPAGPGSRSCNDQECGYPVPTELLQMKQGGMDPVWGEDGGMREDRSEVPADSGFLTDDCTSHLSTVSLASTLVAKSKPESNMCRVSSSKKKPDDNYLEMTEVLGTAGRGPVRAFQEIEVRTVMMADDPHVEARRMRDFSEINARKIMLPILGKEADLLGVPRDVTADGVSVGPTSIFMKIEKYAGMDSDGDTTSSGREPRDEPSGAVFAKTSLRAESTSFPDRPGVEGSDRPQAKVETPSPQPAPPDPLGGPRRESPVLNAPRQLPDGRHGDPGPSFAPPPQRQLTATVGHVEEERSGEPSATRMIQRLQQATALADVEATPSPRSVRGLDTVLCLDVSASMLENGAFEEMKSLALHFLDGVEDAAMEEGLEENVALVTMGGGAQIQQHLTNDYNLVRPVIESLTPSGSSPFVQTLLVCVRALKRRGGVLSVGGGHKLLPRIIIMTDGVPSDETTEPLSGTDPPVTDIRFRMLLLSVMPNFAKLIKKICILWVPVGNSPMGTLESLEKLGVGKIVSKEARPGLARYHFVQKLVGKMLVLTKGSQQDESSVAALEPYMQCLAPNISESEKLEIQRCVEEKRSVPRTKAGSEDESSDSEEEVHPESLALGTRVVRGPHWDWQDQDRGMPGIVIGHKHKGRWLVVRWDHGKAGAYRYKHHGKLDVIEAPEGTPPVELGERMLCVGIAVQRGPDWNSGDEDGGPGSVGIVIRCKDDGRAKVAWNCGKVKMHRYGKDGKYEVKICKAGTPSEHNNLAAPSAHNEDAGFCTPGPTASPPDTQLTWQWCDEQGQWHLYSEENQAKLHLAYGRKPGISGLVVRDGVSFRVLFKTMTERNVERTITHHVRLSAVEKAAHH